MQGLEIEAIYERGTLKLPRELPLVEGATVTITIHPPGRPGVIKHLRIPWTGSLEEFDHWLDDPDEGLFGCHDDDLPPDDSLSLDPDYVVYAVVTESRSSLEREMIPETITLFRPIGQKELELIQASGMRMFPPRLPSQPIFYPVLNEEYAVQIARDWNTKDAASGYAGYVTRFRVKEVFLRSYPVQKVGTRIHQEYWIPAEDLEELNRNIVGEIEVIAEFHPSTSVVSQK